MIFDDYLWQPPGVTYRMHRIVAKIIGWQAVHRRSIAQCATEAPMLGVDSLLATLAGQYEVIGSGYQKAARNDRFSRRCERVDINSLKQLLVLPARIGVDQFDVDGVRHRDSGRRAARGRPL